MDKLATLWAFVRRRKYLITFAAFVVVVGFLDENSIVRRMGYANEISRLNSEIERLSCYFVNFYCRQLHPLLKEQCRLLQRMRR